MKLSFRLAFFASLTFLPAALFAQSPTPRPITVEDALKIREVHDPQLSPDAKWLAYTVTTPKLKDDSNKERIWMLPVPNSGVTPADPIALTSEDASSTHPRWSPDGKYIAFLSGRNDEKTQIWLLNRLGGEAEKLTDTAQDVEEFYWSPDGRRLALILRDPTPEELEDAKDKAEDKDDADSSAKSSEEKSDKDKKKKADKPWVIDRLQFKQDVRGYLDRRRTHIYIFNLVTKSLTQITSGDYDDSSPAWSPDGQQIAFSSNRSAPDPDANYNSDIWVVAADNTDKGAHLTKISSSLGEDHSPSWSPDGKLLAFTTQLDPKMMEYGTKHLAIAPSAGGPVTVLTQSFDRNVTIPHFSPDGKFIYFIADDDGTQNLCRIPTTGGEITRPIGGRLMLYDYFLAKSGEIAAEISKVERPNEIYFLAASSTGQSAGQSTTQSTAEPVRLTHVNDAILSQLRLAPVEYIHYKSKDGTQIAGFLYKPLDYVPGKRVPTLLRPHGGPVWAWYAEFNFDEQLFAANGYAVLLPNPRGSSGYGEKHAKAIFADWGNRDFQDDIAFVDYAIQQGIADPDKLGVGGWSYGGISTDFIIGQTQRFKAAISGAGEALNISNYGHDQYQLDYETELGRPWENQVLWDKLSPFYKVKDITTPTLFMGGEIDSNVPILGGEQMYQALKSLGRVTELVVYPGEYHEFTSPSHIQDKLRRYLAWYGHYVKGDSSPATPPLDPPKPAKSVN